MPLDCPITEEEINALVDGELVGREQRRVAAHVAVCGDCSVQAGEMLASKRLLSARSQPIEPPAMLWDRLVSSLDEVDGVARAAGPPRRRLSFGSVPALATIGCLLVVAAFIWRSHTVRSAGYGAVFVRAHIASCARIMGARALPNVSEVVAPGVSGATWAPIERAVISLDGQFVEHTLYRVGRTPISEFISPTRAFDARGLSSYRHNGTNYLLRGEAGGSVVAWESGGVVRVLVGRTKLSQLLYIASARRAAVPIMRVY